MPVMAGRKVRHGGCSQAPVREPNEIAVTLDNLAREGADRMTSSRISENATRPGSSASTCVKATASNRRRQGCTRFVAVPGAFTRRRPAGAASFTFTGRIANRALTPGRYRLAATPAANGRTGRPARASLRIVRWR
jgi:hypothetical protein